MSNATKTSQRFFVDPETGKAGVEITGVVNGENVAVKCLEFDDRICPICDHSLIEVFMKKPRNEQEHYLECDKCGYREDVE